MSAGTDLAAILDGYLQLGRWWLGAWGTHAKGVAARLDQPSYPADEAVADLTDCARLAAESWLLAANEAIDAAAVLSGQHHQPHLVTSVEFTVPAGTEETGQSRKLALTGPLVAVLGGGTIPASAVTLAPNPVAAGSGFVLEVDASGRPGVTYLGGVATLDAAGVPVATVDVWVSVP